MKILLFFALLFSPTIIFSQSVKDLFLQIPENYLQVSITERAKLITETEGDFLKFKLSEKSRGELKIINRKTDEVWLGMTTNDCDGNTLQFWKIKKGVWKEATKEIIKPLGKDDVFNILAVSPVTITKIEQQPEIATFYEFSAQTTQLRLIARRQDSCDIAGTVYTYGFNGKKFEIAK